MAISEINKIRTKSPDEIIKKDLYEGAAPAAMAHVNKVIEKVNEVITEVNTLSLEGYKGVIDCAANPNYPAGEKDWFWRVSVSGKIGGGSGLDVEAGDQIICIATSAGGTQAAVGANYMIIQKNQIPCTVTVLRAGTNDTDFVTAKTLADQGFTFSAATKLGISGGTTEQLSITNISSADGIVMSGTFNNGINMLSASPFDEAYTIAGTGTRNNPYIKIGSWDDPITLTNVLDHLVAIQVNIANNGAASTSNFAAARLRTDTAVNSTANHYALQTRCSIAHNVASAYGINASMSFGTTTIGTGSAAVISAYLEGTGTITPAGANPVDVVNITNVHSGTGVTNCLNVCNNTASVVSTVATLSNLAGAVTSMLYINNANTATNGLLVSGTYTTGISLTGTYTTGISVTGIGTTAEGINITATALTTGHALQITASVNSSYCQVINVDVAPSAALTGSEAVIGCDIAVQGNGSDADSTSWTCYNGKIEGVSTGRADYSVYTVDMIGTLDTADTHNGLVISFGQTMNNASATVYGTRISTSSFTHTQGTWYGHYINQTYTTTAGISTAIAIDSVLSSATTKAVEITSTSATATATLINSMKLIQIMSGASSTNMIEAAQFIVQSAVQMGNWANAILAKIDLTTTGYVTGLAGVVCAELDMPSTGPSGSAGTYTCFEAEINMAGATNVPVSVITANVWGAETASFGTSGYIMDLTIPAAGTGLVFQANGALASTHALRIRINGIPYYIMLTDTGA